MMCVKLWSQQQRTTNCKFINNDSDYTFIIKANGLRDFALIIAIINTLCFHEYLVVSYYPFYEIKMDRSIDSWADTCEPGKLLTTQI